MVYCRSGGGVVCVFKKRTAVRYYSSAQRDSASLSPLRELAPRVMFHHHQPTKVLRIMSSVNPSEMKPCTALLLLLCCLLPFVVVLFRRNISCYG